MDYIKVARLPVEIPRLGGRADRPPAGDHQGGARPRGSDQGGRRLCAVGPVRASAAAHGRLGDVLRRTSGRFLAALTRRRGRRRLWPDGGIRPDTDRIDDDYPATGHGQAVALCDNDGEAEVVGVEPIHCRERQPGAAGSRGSRGRSVPLPDSQCTHIGYAGFRSRFRHLSCQGESHPRGVFVLRELRFLEPLVQQVVEHDGCRVGRLISREDGWR